MPLPHNVGAKLLGGLLNNNQIMICFIVHLPYLAKWYSRGDRLARLYASTTPITHQCAGLQPDRRLLLGRVARTHLFCRRFISGYSGDTAWTLAWAGLVDGSQHSLLDCLHLALSVYSGEYVVGGCTPRCVECLGWLLCGGPQPARDCDLLRVVLRGMVSYSCCAAFKYQINTL